MRLNVSQYGVPYFYLPYFHISNSDLYFAENSLVLSFHMDVVFTGFPQIPQNIWSTPSTVRPFLCENYSNGVSELIVSVFHLNIRQSNPIVARR